MSIDDTGLAYDQFALAHDQFWDQIVGQRVNYQVNHFITVGGASGLVPRLKSTALNYKLHSHYNGIFQDLYQGNDPLGLVLVKHSGLPIASAVLSPDSNWVSYSSPVSGYTKLGLIGVFVTKEYRGRGYARLAMRGLSKLVNRVRINKVCVVAEHEIVRMSSEIFKVPVFSRYRSDRVHRS